jgi:hypothetical protein
MIRILVLIQKYIGTYFDICPELPENGVHWFSTINHQNPLSRFETFIYIILYNSPIRLLTSHPLLAITIIKIGLYGNQTVLKLEILL